MIGGDRAPGWDKRAINAIAERDYGGLRGLFDAHGWSDGGRTLGQIAPTRVVETYGSVAAFAARRQESAWPGLEEILATPQPDVWLTSFYGFAPRNWGFLGFTIEWMRARFLRESNPGALVVVYAASGAQPAERGKIIGIQQMGRRVGEAREFMTPQAWAEKQANPDRRDKWNLAVQAVRAWQVTPESRMPVHEFAPDTYTPGRSQVIGAQGLKLTANEARRILKLDLVEVSVFGGPRVEHLLPGSALEILRPSRPGPVSQAPHTTREAEGPKHLYVLRLAGNADHLLGRPVGALEVIKVGFSRSPETRCADHNRTLPACAFDWRVMRSTFADGREALPSSRHARAGEAVMKDALEQAGESLGGEFFLADRQSVERAWVLGLKAAEGWQDA